MMQRTGISNHDSPRAKSNSPLFEGSNASFSSKPAHIYRTIREKLEGFYVRFEAPRPPAWFT
jgi:hypothetical protein